MSLNLREGTVFGGRYRVLSRIAAGGMGAVYEVLHLETVRRRALKVMHAHIFQDAEMCERFQREARVTATIESEFIVDVFDAGIDVITELPFLVMELLRGEELGKRLKRFGRLAPAEVVTYLWQTALALDKTHAASIVHRDLKPSNLFLTYRDDNSPRIKILDFGVAKLVAQGTTHAGATRSVGTPLYMAPEQFRMDTTVSPASDIYALGMMAYTLLVGQPYWAEEGRHGANVFAFAAVAMQGPREAASVRAARVGAQLPSGFDAWFATATAVDPARRFVKASLAVDALTQILGTRIVGSPAAPAPGAPGGAQRTTELAVVGSAIEPATIARSPVTPVRPEARAILLALGVGVVLGGGTLAVLRSRVQPPGVVGTASPPLSVTPSARAAAAQSAPLDPPATAAPPPAVAPIDSAATPPPASARAPSGVSESARGAKPLPDASLAATAKPKPTIYSPD